MNNKTEEEIMSMNEEELKNIWKNDVFVKKSAKTATLLPLFAKNSYPQQQTQKQMMFFNNFTNNINKINPSFQLQQQNQINRRAFVFPNIPQEFCALNY